jgi:uncharacterized protein (DUF4415 family)
MKKTYINEEFVMADGAIVRGTTDWEAIAALTDEEIHAAALTDPDNPPTTPAEWKQARRVRDISGKTLREKLQALADENKQLVSVRYDPDVIAFFRAQGKGYQSLMNKVLRNYMETQLSRHAG